MGDLNRAIDDVAARMTAGDAPAGLRARVLGRIGDRRPSTWTWALKPVAALAALVLVGVTVQILRTSRPADRRDSPAAHLATATAPTTTGVAAATANVDRVSPPAPRVRPKPAPPRMSAAEAAWHERAIPALDAIAALSIDAIQPEALSIPQLEVKALATTPLVVATDGKGVR
jgi:hypothetical protein